MKLSLTLASAALIATFTFSSTASAETAGESQGWGGFFGGIDGDVQKTMSSIRSIFLEAKAEILEQYSNLRRDRAARAELRAEVRELRQQAREARGEALDASRSAAREVRDAARAAAEASNQVNRNGERAAQRRAPGNAERGNDLRSGAGESNGRRIQGDNGRRVRGENGQRNRGENGRRGLQRHRNASSSVSSAQGAE